MSKMIIYIYIYIYIYILFLKRNQTFKRAHQWYDLVFSWLQFCVAVELNLLGAYDKFPDFFRTGF